MSVSGRTSLYCVIGDPVSHSLSPVIMNRAFAACGIDAIYVACTVRRSRAAQAAKDLQALGFAGANVTYPCKESVIVSIDRASKEVGVIQAVNTLRLTGARIEGFNTDAPGTARAIERLANVDLEDKRAFIFGAGGAARAAAYGLFERGVIEVTFAVRDEGKGSAVVERFGEAIPGSTIHFIPWSPAAPAGDASRKRIEGKVADADIVINATPIGMTGYDPTTLLQGDSWIHPRHLCFDFVYHPRETPFLETARRRGARSLDGLALLVSQAEEAFRIWTGKGFSIAEMLDAVSTHLSARTAGNR